VSSAANPSRWRSPPANAATARSSSRSWSRSGCPDPGRSGRVAARIGCWPTRPTLRARTGLPGCRRIPATGADPTGRGAEPEEHRWRRVDHDANAERRPARQWPLPPRAPQPHRRGVLRSSRPRQPDPWRPGGSR
jgi:hypothetical protein